MNEALNFNDLHNLPKILDGIGPDDILREFELPENDFPEILALSQAIESVGTELAYLVNSTAGNPFHPFKTIPPEFNKTDPAASSQLRTAMLSFGMSETTSDDEIRQAVESAAWLAHRYNAVREMTPDGYLQPIPGDLIQLELISSLLRGVMLREDAGEHKEVITLMYKHLMSTLTSNGVKTQSQIVLQRILRGGKLEEKLTQATDPESYCALLRLKYRMDIVRNWNSFQRGLNI